MAGKSKADKKKLLIRIVAVALAALMVGSVLFSVLAGQVY